MLMLILKAILYGLALLCYYIEVALGMLLDLCESMFDVFAGVTTVKYNGEAQYLLDVFLGDELISAVYKGMAMVGICMAFGFALIAVIRKLFDSSGERVKATYGSILMGLFKSSLIILLLTAIVVATTTACSVILSTIKDIFNNATEVANPTTIYFDDTDRANMFRVIDTVANYSMNPSPETRFNINICFNEISADMQTLEASGMFRYSYEGAEDSWQYYLRKIYIAGDIHTNIPIDEYNDSVSTAIIDLMNQTKYNSNFRPLEKYSRSYSLANDASRISTMIMLSSSFDAAKNPRYNGDKASISDGVRGPFYNGSLDIYSRKVVENSFDLNFGSWNHLLCIIAMIFVIYAFAKMIFNCTARIFNIVFLYIMAPPFIAVMPLDDGGKFKQWLTAFIIQTTSIIGVYVSIRVMIMFIPIIMSSNLELFSGSFLNIFAKVILLVGVAMTADKASGMITGILSDNAGMRAVMAGEIGAGAVGKALHLGGKIGSGLATATGLKTLKNKAHKSMEEHGGIIGGAVNAKKEKAENKRKNDRDEANARHLAQIARNSSGGDKKEGGAPDKGGGAKDIPNRGEKNISGSASRNKESGKSSGSKSNSGSNKSPQSNNDMSSLGQSDFNPPQVEFGASADVNLEGGDNGAFDDAYDMDLDDDDFSDMAFNPETGGGGASSEVRDIPSRDE